MKLFTGNSKQKVSEGYKALCAPDIPSQYFGDFQREISFQNLQRIRLVMFPVLLFFCYLLWVDLFRYTPAKWGESNYFEWFLLDLSFVAVCGSILFLGRLRKPGNCTEITRYHKGIVLAFTTYLLGWAVAGTALDQLAYGEITTYILVVFVVTATIVFETRPRFFLYFLSHACFFAAISMLQPDERKLMAHTTNALATIIVSWTLAHLIYVRQVRSFLDRKLIERQAGDIQRANEELQSANGELQKLNLQLGNSLEETNILLAQLTETNHNLEALNEEKNEFLGIAAHDLKNPLSGILLNAEIVRNYASSMSSAEISAQMLKIEDTSRRMYQIISELLNVNALETGNFSFERERINAAELAEATVSDYMQRAEEKGIRLLFESGGTDIHALADRNAFIEITENLLSNAIKFSPKEKCVYVSILHDTGTVRLEIRDEGPGLTEEDKQKLFGKYARLSARPTAGEHSTGLGLSIVKRMTEALDGRIICESEAGAGAKFIVELPAAIPEAVPG